MGSEPTALCLGTTGGYLWPQLTLAALMSARFTARERPGCTRCLPACLLACLHAPIAVMIARSGPWRITQL